LGEEEKKFSARDRLLAHALENIRECVSITDLDDKIIYVNSAFKKEYGYSEEELIGKHLEILRPKTVEPESVKNIFPDSLLGGWEGEILNVRKSGTVFPIELRTSVVRDEDEKPIALIGVASDITKRRTDESERLNYINKLQNAKELLEKRTTELNKLNLKLQESEKILREANISKDKFFSIISHDLRSPFSSVLGFSELLTNELDELSREEIQLFSDNIYVTLKNLYKMIENLLQWSRMQLGRMNCEPVKINVYALLESVIELIKGNADKKNIRIFNSVSENITVISDSNMLYSVFQNLLTNAIKFTSANGKINIKSSLCGQRAEISVSDNGIGMNENELNKIFKIDTQFTKKGTWEEDGTGLGLLLCKDMLTLNNASISVISKPQVGSTFSVNLPAANLK
jgi:PAS domain S-box-containing protein